MKKTILTLVVTLASMKASAMTPAIIKKIAANIKVTDTRTIVKTVMNTDGNPCMPEGTSYIVEVQVKQAAYNYDIRDVVYSWETVKSVGVDKDGRVTEVCAE